VNHFRILIIIPIHYHLDVQIMWLKSRAQAHRWREEVELLKEEMDCTQKFLEWEEGWWNSQVNRRQPTVLVSDTPVTDVTLLEGLEAYAHCQADLQRRLCEHFGYLWRDVGSWINKGEVPTQQNWYSSLAPEDSPHLYCY
jgi:hypothetical protein